MSSFPVYFALMIIDSHNKTIATFQSTKNIPVATYDCAK